MLLLNDGFKSWGDLIDEYFNTSYVVIKQMEKRLSRKNAKNFNTSYVVIKRKKNT